MNWKKEPREQLTFFPCSVCSNRLTSFEYASGTVCVSCTAIAKGHKKPPPPIPIKADKEQLKREQSARDVAAMVAKWETEPAEIPLKSFDVNYCGLIYSVLVVVGKDLEPMAIISIDGRTIWENGAGTQEGQYVIFYCKSEMNKILNEKVK